MIAVSIPFYFPLCDEKIGSFQELATTVMLVASEKSFWASFFSVYNLGSLVSVEGKSLVS